MQRLYREGEQKRALLNLAIRRLAIAEKRTKGWEHEQRVLNWERLYLRMSEAKGHGRRWRFRVEGVKKKAEEGYDELVKWIGMRDGFVEEENDSQDDMYDQNGASHIERDDDIDLEDGEQEGLGLEEHRPERGDRGDRGELQRRRAKLMGGVKKKRAGRGYDDDLSNLSVDLDRKSPLSAQEIRPRDRKKSPGGGGGDDVCYDML